MSAKKIFAGILIGSLLTFGTLEVVKHLEKKKQSEKSEKTLQERLTNTLWMKPQEEDTIILEFSPASACFYRQRGNECEELDFFSCWYTKDNSLFFGDKEFGKVKLDKNLLIRREGEILSFEPYNEIYAITDLNLDGSPDTILRKPFTRGYCFWVKVDGEWLFSGAGFSEIKVTSNITNGYRELIFDKEKVFAFDPNTRYYEEKVKIEKEICTECQTEARNLERIVEEEIEERPSPEEWRKPTKRESQSEENFDENWKDWEKRDWLIFPSMNLAIKIHKIFQKIIPDTSFFGKTMQTYDNYFLVLDMEMRALKEKREIGLPNFEISNGKKRERTYNQEVMKAYEILNPGKGRKVSCYTISDIFEVGSSPSATQRRNLPFWIAQEKGIANLVNEDGSISDVMHFVVRIDGVIYLCVGKDSAQITTINLSPRYGYLKPRIKIE